MYVCMHIKSVTHFLFNNARPIQYKSNECNSATFSFWHSCFRSSFEIALSAIAGLILVNNLGRGDQKNVMFCMSRQLPSIPIQNCFRLQPFNRYGTLDLQCRTCQRVDSAWDSFSIIQRNEFCQKMKNSFLWVIKQSTSTHILQSQKCEKWNVCAYKKW